MVRRNDMVPVLAHLVGVGAVGCFLTGVQFVAVVIGLVSDDAEPPVAALVAVMPFAVSLLAGFALSARSLVPLTRRARGLWIWAAAVYGLGTAGAIGAAAVHFRVYDGENDLAALYLSGGVCYALAAAFFLPGTRIRAAALATAAALAVGGGYVSWQAAQPPTPDEWIADNRVDRALLRVGEPPTGYVLQSVGASEDGFGATYTRPGSPDLHLGVERSGADTRRRDAQGCPVPFGVPIRCTDDGDGRQLVTYGGSAVRQELVLRRDGLAHTVTIDGNEADLPGARHILLTLRPATDGELRLMTDGAASAGKPSTRGGSFQEGRSETA
ncbi:hypothetical protein ACIBCM_13515 [Streptomyces sp. NPDC051018]|uniref:hypothetical protein n=1 Tax=Streptomyces sp. NPDC051018 TaxID=3365639 RepID=UPI00379C3447